MAGEAGDLALVAFFGFAAKSHLRSVEWNFFIGVNPGGQYRGPYPRLRVLGVYGWHHNSKAWREGRGHHRLQAAGLIRRGFVGIVHASGAWAASQGHRRVGLRPLPAYHLAAKFHRSHNTIIWNILFSLGYLSSLACSLEPRSQTQHVVGRGAIIWLGSRLFEQSFCWAASPAFGMVSSRPSARRDRRDNIPSVHPCLEKCHFVIPSLRLF